MSRCCTAVNWAHRKGNGGDRHPKIRQGVLIGAGAQHFSGIWEIGPVPRSAAADVCPTRSGPIARRRHPGAVVVRPAVEAPGPRNGSAVSPPNIGEGFELGSLSFVSGQLLKTPLPTYN